MRPPEWDDLDRSPRLRRVHHPAAPDVEADMAEPEKNRTSPGFSRDRGTFLPSP